MFTEVFDQDLESNIRAPEASFLYALWQVLRGGAFMPEESALPQKRIAYLKADMMILRPVGSSNWRYHHYGSNIIAQAGFDMTGQTVADFKGPTRAFYLDVYERVSRTCKPMASVHRLGRFSETPLWERLILPFGTYPKVSCLYVVNKVREFARDMSHLNARARERGLIALQFVRDDAGQIRDAEIVGANVIARDLMNRRYDEVVGHRCGEVLPGFHAPHVWQACLDAVETRHSQSIEVEFIDQGFAGRYRMEICPLFDGVTAVFTPVETRHEHIGFHVPSTDRPEGIVR